MRGFLSPSLKANPSDSQKHFQTLSRGRRVKLARAAKTSLVKADQWARGEAVAGDIGSGLEHGVKALVAKKK